MATVQEQNHMKKFRVGSKRTLTQHRKLLLIKKSELLCKDNILLNAVVKNYTQLTEYSFKHFYLEIQSTGLQ